MLQQTPISVIFLPPSSFSSPPETALVRDTSETTKVATVGIVKFFLQEHIIVNNAIGKITRINIFIYNFIVK
jgi:hypothetical protein